MSIDMSFTTMWGPRLYQSTFQNLNSTELLINVKMQTNNDILTFISTLNTPTESLKAIKSHFSAF